MTDAERGAELVLECLAGAHHGEVVAVWADGEISLEQFNFFARRRNGALERPVVEFICTGRRPSRVEVMDRLLRGFVQAEGSLQRAR